ncbi:hypothetical protein [Actinoplanes sp. M2I2]|uniref:hypothetical protein n=1 Tax=Actinoplanes sp. M2I2 TaxID=1734444 RepID=UPI002020639D|nr:hypothetical protein [Actinoplanes sp. M2I2]
MTDDYGRRDPSRGYGSSEGQWAPPDTARHGDVPPQRTGTQYGGRPYAPSSGAPPAPPARQPWPAPTGPAAPGQRPAPVSPGGPGRRPAPVSPGVVGQRPAPVSPAVPGQRPAPVSPGVPGRRPAPQGDGGQPYRAGGTYGRPGEYGGAPQEEPAPLPAFEPEPERRSRKPLVFVLLLVLAAAGGGGWYYLRGSDKPPTAQELRVADRGADPSPLTVREVFPSATVPGADGAYKVLKTQETAKCDAAASGAIAQELATAGCTQVVRATMTSPDGALVITAGLFNLESRAKTEKAAAAIKEAVDKGTGRFGGLLAGGPSDIVSRAAANLAWEVRGHYLVYSLVAEADGSAITEDDARAQVVRADLVETYLGGGVVGKRENGGAAPAGPVTQPS